MLHVHTLFFRYVTEKMPESESIVDNTACVIISIAMYNHRYSSREKRKHYYRFMTAMTLVDGINDTLRNETPYVWFPFTAFATPNSVSNEDTVNEVNDNIYMILLSCIYNINAI